MASLRQEREEGIVDNWSVTCGACGVEYKVKASSKAEAIAKAKAEHERVNAEATAFRCDCGPSMYVAFNLTHPTHPCAPKEW